MSAASWLVSPEQSIARMNFDYDIVDGQFNRTGAVTVEFDLNKIKPEALPRLESLLHRASLVEINFHLNRLLLHRRKASLGEHSIPMFIDDITRDLYMRGVTSLGMAMTVDHLRREGKNQWFPEWNEIESASASIEASIKKAKENIQALLN